MLPIFMGFSGGRGDRRKGERLEIVTIDGPAGAGKSTVSKILARRLNYIYLDTGAMYRAVALRAQVEGVDPKDEPALERLCANLEISFQETGEGQRLICQGEDVTERIREPEIGWMASVVSMMRPVREAMGVLQRKMGSRGGVVAEGRDMGTVVFPGARFKFFLVADPRERSLRRYRELKAKGREIKLEEVEREVRERDAQDSSRELAPLRTAEDAHLIDSTGLTPEGVVARMLAIIQKN
jgi:cytidylate kinase